MTLSVTVVTMERVVYETDDADMVVVPGVEGVLGILAGHEPIVTTLKAGMVEVLHGDEREIMAIGGGFLEAHASQVVVMADVAERASEISVERAEAARRRAQEQLATASDAAAREQALAAGRRAAVRLHVAHRSRATRGT